MVRNSSCERKENSLLGVCESCIVVTPGNWRGLWDGDRDPATILDLWADIEPVLTSIDVYQASVQADAQTLFNASSAIAPPLNTLGSCERIAIWGLTP